MRDYYDILEIEKSADENAIKRAYFRLVRKYAPERYPDEFKLLRAAYETLSESSAREEYDRSGNLPGESAYLFRQVKLARYEQRFEDATTLMKLIVQEHPELLSMKFELARAYEDEDKTGNAIKVWEELCKAAPENSVYALELAQSYKYRGWRLKAIGEFKRALMLDSDDAQAWLELIECFDEADDDSAAEQYTLQAISVLREKREGSLELYTKAFRIYTDNRDDASATELLEPIMEMLADIKTFPVSERENAIHIIIDAVREPLLNTRGSPAVAARKEISGNVLYRSAYQYYKTMQNLAQDMDELVQENVRIAKNEAEILFLDEEHYCDPVCSLLLLLANECDCETCTNNILAVECRILSNLKRCLPDILRLIESHPDLYDLGATFFDEAATTQTPEKMLYYRQKQLSRKGLQTIFRDGDLDDPENDISPKPEVFAGSGTYRREGPKIGRNDPCPCGSGKKYKKCCGA